MMLRNRIISPCASLDLEREIDADTQVWDAAMPLTVMCKIVEETDFREEISS